MKEVTYDYFHSKIGKLDVVLNIVTDFPYTTEFKLRHGGIVGKIVDSYPRPITRKYYTNL